MAERIEIQAGFDLVSVEPDGSKCMLCGEACLLEQWHAMLVLNDVQTTDVLGAFCMSCVKVLQDHFDNDKGDSPL